jgi:hypothetical protein
VPGFCLLKPGDVCGYEAGALQGQAKAVERLRFGRAHLHVGRARQNRDAGLRCAAEVVGQSLQVGVLQTMNMLAHQAFADGGIDGIAADDLKGHQIRRLGKRL